MLTTLGMPDTQPGRGDRDLRQSRRLPSTGADLVLENVSEKLEIKAEVFRQIDKLVGKDCIIASDTSGIPITKLQAIRGGAGARRRHALVEPAPYHPDDRGDRRRRDRAKDRSTGRCDLIKGLGLLPVVVKKDVPGFVENRVLYALLRECVDLVEQGVIDAEGLDTCVSWGIGYKLSVVGPDGAARYGRPRHLPGGRQLPE